MELYDHLQRLEAMGDPIKVGLVGCGQMGSGLVHVTNQMKGMNTVAISDLDISRPLKTFRKIGVPDEKNLRHPQCRRSGRCAGAGQSAGD